MASTFTCPKCHTVSAAALGRCPKCGTVESTGAGEEAMKKSLLAKLEETEGKPLNLGGRSKAGATDGKKSSERIKLMVGLLGAAIGLTAAVIALVSLWA